MFIVRLIVVYIKVFFKHQTLCGVLMLLGTASLLGLLSLFRPGHPRTRQPFRNEFLLLSPVALVARLIVLYRMECVNPIMENYTLNLMSLLCLSSAFFALISFLFRLGSYQKLSFYGGCSIVLCTCSLADSPDWISTVFLNLGSSLILLGFLALFLWREDAAPMA